MDTSDPGIVFHDGICNHCKSFDHVIESGLWQPNELGSARLASWVDKVKKAQRKERYDCIIGLSGGVDSSYLAVVAHKLGLRCLAVHVDAGWNSEIAVRNIEVLVKGLKMDLVTHVVDWEEMRNLQVAFLKSGVPNQDIPQDHAFFSALYQTARKWGIRFQLQGRNFVSESVLPKSWGYNAMDGIHLRAINDAFGKQPLRRYHVMSVLEYADYFVGLPWRSEFEVFDPLNWMPYDPRKARVELHKDYGWTDYGQKHWESHWTKFFQSYYLPTRFGFDKRRAHLASLVLSGSIERNEALAELQQPAFDERRIVRDLEFVRRKLELDVGEWSRILTSPVHLHEEYKTGASRIDKAMRAAFFARPASWRKIARSAMRKAGL